MGSTRGAVPTPSANLSSHFFLSGRSAKKPFTRPICVTKKNQLEMKKMQMSSVLGEKLGGLHQQGNQRSAPQSAQKCVPQKKTMLLNSVLGANLEDLPDHDDDEELECQ